MHGFLSVFLCKNHVRYIQPFLSCRRQNLSLTKALALVEGGSLL